MKKPDAAKYILATSGQEDYGNREVGPIHLVKYVYLADLAFAEKRGGETITGIPWRFHHFGPWSPEVYNRDNRDIEIDALEISVTRESRFNQGIMQDLPAGKIH